MNQDQLISAPELDYRRKSPNSFERRVFNLLRNMAESNSVPMFITWMGEFVEGTRQMSNLLEDLISIQYLKSPK